MYISRIQVKRGPELFRLTQSDIRDSLYAAHQLLWKVFPRDADAERDFLFRQEDRAGLPCFFVVSERWPMNDALFKIESKDYAPQLEVGQRLAFSLTANPVVARKVEGRKKSTKHDVWMDARKEAKNLGLSQDKWAAHCEAKTCQWLIDRSESLGFEIEEEQFRVDGYYQHQFHRRKGKPIRFSSVDFNGLLTVVDPNRLRQTLFEGVGRSRAFGCGLMLVRRVSRR